MKAADLEKCGIPQGEIVDIAIKAIASAAKTNNYPEGFKTIIQQIVCNPHSFTKDPCFNRLARALIKAQRNDDLYKIRKKPAPYRIWGKEFEKEA